MRSEKIVFTIESFNLILGGSFDIQFLILVFLIAVYKEIKLILRSENIVFIIKGFNLILGRKLRNPVFGNILTALYKEILLILRSEK